MRLNLYQERLRRHFLLAYGKEILSAHENRGITDSQALKEFDILSSVADQGLKNRSLRSFYRKLAEAINLKSNAGLESFKSTLLSLSKRSRPNASASMKNCKRLIGKR